jgi:hypothetical protein
VSMGGGPEWRPPGAHGVNASILPVPFELQSSYARGRAELGLEPVLAGADDPDEAAGSPGRWG